MDQLMVEYGDDVKEDIEYAYIKHLMVKYGKGVKNNIKPETVDTEMVENEIINEIIRHMVVKMKMGIIMIKSHINPEFFKNI